MSTGRPWSTADVALEAVGLEESAFSNYGYTDNDGEVTWSFFDESGQVIASVTVDAETGEVVE